ncbi:NUDIX domain-containing protein [Mesorhizobium sp.]|uniref:NUDIX domain-containing protein n=1 Tax=Mesorhizobium sp. TaxID=1871066 RepID=UPI000FE71744|nr:NUDIX domain-containing protein [Mesorhizobium sp.]RWK43756.1 MAG: NUDIX domain-containing protein [Mesorhizobium sp.]
MQTRSVFPSCRVTANSASSRRRNCGGPRERARSAAGNDPSACYAFIGGEYEVGDTFETRLRKEFEEETTARLVECEYLFCVENHFQHRGNAIQQAEHFFLVKLDRRDVESREPHLRQHWLPITELASADLRPHTVRSALIDGTYLTRRYLLQTEA